MPSQSKFSRKVKLYFYLLQDILSDEDLSLKLLDVITILLKYCGPKCTEKGETQAVITDLIGTIGFFCANNEKNQVSHKSFNLYIKTAFYILNNNNMVMKYESI